MVVHKAGVEMRAMEGWKGKQCQPRIQRQSNVGNPAQAFLWTADTSPAIDQLCGFEQLAWFLWPSGEWENALS